VRMDARKTSAANKGENKTANKKDSDDKDDDDDSAASDASMPGAP